MKKKQKTLGLLLEIPLIKVVLIGVINFGYYLWINILPLKIFMSVHSKQKVLRKLIKNPKNLILDDFGLFNS